MGQYYVIANLDKQEYISPHDFGDGDKLMEFGLSRNGIMSGLAILLADGNEEGNGGDLYSDNPIIGSWKGDRIVVAGDYSKKNVKGTDENVYNYAKHKFKNISADAMAALLDDGYYASEAKAKFGVGGGTLGKETYIKAKRLQKKNKSSATKVKV